MLFLKDKINLYCAIAYSVICFIFVFENFTPPDKVIYYIIAYTLGFIISVFLFFRNKNSSNISFAEIITVTVTLKIILIFAAPVTSNDYTRYLWDGKVQAAGINPFKYAPEDKELDFLQDDQLYPLITYKEIKTIYPPFAQIIFLINQFLFSGSVAGLKFIFLICDIGVIFFLYKILLFLKLNTNLILLYALSPLILFEIILNVHVDILLLFFLTGCIYYCLKNSFNISFFMLGFSVMSKLYSLIFVPVLIYQYISLGNKKLFITIIIFFALPFLMIAPYYNGFGEITGVINNYDSHWYFNAMPFKSVAEIFHYFGMVDHQVIRTGFRILFVIILLYYSFSSKPFFNKLFYIIFFYFFLNTTVYPWYLIPLSMILVINFNYSFLFWTGIIGFTNLTVYVYLKSGVWEDNKYVLLCEYLILSALFIFENIKNQQI
ncbi:MAG: hypothetical protein M3P82_05435 [Bacteroidota bacterium]|nr:hypothetical protein [Bacteroidota bacterium]